MTMHSFLRVRTALATLPLALIVAGCTVGPNFARPEASATGGYAPVTSNRAALGEAAPRTWWQAFGSAELDSLVDRALANNASLEASRATLQRARERVNAVAGKRLPQVDASGKVQHQQFNLSAIGLGDRFASAGIPAMGNPEFDLYTLGAGVSYDLDLFGGNRRALEQAGAEARAQTRQAEAAHLLIAGRVVLQAMAIAALNDRIATERALIAEAERNLSLTDQRRRAGVGTMVEVLSAEGQLASDRAALPALEQALTEARGILAVLLGVSPAELGATDYSLDQFSLPEQVPVTLPSQLVRGRPDIVEAEERLHAATAAIGMAEARLYPDITLGATISQSSTDPGNLTKSGFRGFDIFAGLAAPIFHGGTLRAEKRGAEAGARAAAASYRQVVLDAFAQVSGLLSALDTDGRALAAQQQTAQVAERSLHLSRRSFEVGNSGILQVLDASRANQRARIALVQARAQQYANVARLLAATAGGWTGSLDRETGSGGAD